MEDDGNQVNDPAPARIVIGPRAVAAALTVARDFADAAGCGAETRARLAIVVEELVFNLIDHGGMAEGDCIELALSLEDQAVRLSISDCGAPFDPRGAPPPGELPPERGGGAGIAMVLAWSDIEDYTREGERNRLTLRLRRFD